MLNVKLSNSQLSKLKSAIKNWTEVILNLSQKLIRNSDDWTSFPHKLLLTDKQVSKIRKAFAYGSAVNIKCSKTHCLRLYSQEEFLLTYLHLYYK